MKYAEELENAGLHNAVDKILVKFPHLEELAGIAAGHIEDLP